MNRRFFMEKLASGLVAAVAPALFLPKLIKPGWKVPVQPAQLVAVDPALSGAEGSIVCYVSLKMTSHQLSYISWSAARAATPHPLPLSPRRGQTYTSLRMTADSKWEIEWKPA